MATERNFVCLQEPYNLLIYRPYIHLAPIKVFNYFYFYEVVLKTDWLNEHGIDLDIECPECDTNPGCMNKDAPCPNCIVQIDETEYFMNPRLLLDEYYRMVSSIKDVNMTRDHCMQVYPDFAFFIGYPDDNIYGNGSNYIETEEVKQKEEIPPPVLGVKRKEYPPLQVVCTFQRPTSLIMPDGDPNVDTDDEIEAEKAAKKRKL